MSTEHQLKHIHAHESITFESESYTLGRLLVLYTEVLVVSTEHQLKHIHAHESMTFESESYTLGLESCTSKSKPEILHRKTHQPLDLNRKSNILCPLPLVSHPRKEELESETRRAKRFGCRALGRGFEASKV